MNQIKSGKGKRRKITQKIAILLLVFLLPTLCVVSIIQSRSLPVDFCTPNDAVYQNILENYEVWLDHFQNLPSQEYPILRFTIGGEKEYTVDASTWDVANELPEFFVQTKSARQEPFGASGYVYSQTGQTTLDHRYEIEPIAENLYCYKFR